MEPTAASDDSQPKRGQEFTHASFLRDAADGTRSPAVMKVTAVQRGAVFYTYADSPTNKGDWRMPIDDWVERYATPNPSKTTQPGIDGKGN